MEIIHLDTIDSTNRYCELLDLDQVEEFTIVYADEQTAGKGQQSHVWESQTGKNLTLSLILHPTFIQIPDQYQLHKALSLAVVDLLKALGISNLHIKWPNDIYVADKKICGILVANKLSKNILQSSICGIGLNVNQTEFPAWVPNPISISQITHQKYDLPLLLSQLAQCLMSRYQILKRGELQHIDRDYMDCLMNLGVEKKYLYQSETILATITGINRYGHLLLKTSKQEGISCQMGEISLIS